MRTGADREALMRDLLGLRIALTLGGVLLATAFALVAGYAPALLAGTVLAALSVVALVFQHTLSIPLTTSLRLGYLSGLELARQAVAVVLFVAPDRAGCRCAAAAGGRARRQPGAAPADGGAGTREISMRMSFRPRRWAELLRLTVAFSLASAANTIYL